MTDLFLLDRYHFFFPNDHHGAEEFDKAVDDGDIIIDSDRIVNLLKSTLVDEAVVEVELEELTRIFFCRILDHPPELEETEVDGETILVEPEYEMTGYLDEQDHLVITPLEPAIGNFLICSVSRLILRILGSKSAFELGCSLIGKIRVRGMPVLKLSFPVVARQVKGARAYRAKIPDEMELRVHVERSGQREDFDTCVIDISVEGMRLLDPFAKQTTLREEEKIQLLILWPRARSIAVRARIIHVSQLRDKEGIQYVFGVQFDLATRALAREIEQLVAGVQRRRLRELSDIGTAFGIDFSSQ